MTADPITLPANDALPDALTDAQRRRFALATEVGRYRAAVKLAIAELELALHYPNGGGVAEAIRILKSAVTEIEGRG